MLDLIMWLALAVGFGSTFWLGAIWGDLEAQRRLAPKLNELLSMWDRERAAYKEFRDAAFDCVETIADTNAELCNAIQNSHEFERPYKLN